MCAQMMKSPSDPSRNRMCPSLLGSVLLENEGILGSAKLDVRLSLGLYHRCSLLGWAAEERVAGKVIWGRVVCVISSGPHHRKQAGVTDAEAWPVHPCPRALNAD